MAEKDYQKICIIGGGFINKGAEAMTRVVADYFFDKNGLQSLVIILKDRKKKIENNKIEEYYDNPSKILLFVDIFRAIIFFFIGRTFVLSKRLKKLNYARFFIDVHGYHLHNERNFRGIFHSSHYILLARLLKKKFYFFPQSVGYLNSFMSRFVVRFLLFFASKIYVRGEESRKNLSRMTKRKIFIEPDIAFLFSAGESKVDSILKENNIELSERKIIGVIPNTNLCDMRKDYIDVLSRTLDSLVESGDYKIVIMPHEIKEKRRDDLFICEEIYQKVKEENKKYLFIIQKRGYGAEDYKRIVSICDIVISSRFHGAVAALSQNIPTITLGWSFKYKELMRWFDMEDFAIDGLLEEELEGILEEKVGKLISNEYKIQKVLEEKNEGIRIRLNTFFDDIAKEIL